MSRLETIILRFLGRLLYAALVLKDFVLRVKPREPVHARERNNVYYNIVDDSTGQVVGHVVGRKEEK